MKWYLIEPIDTLFFRTAEPMDIGESHDAKNIFPPTTQTIIGAFRTLALLQNNISFKDYYEGNVKQEILDKIGTWDNEYPFEVVGPFFKLKDKYFVPSPYCWYKNEEESNKNEENNDKVESKAYKISNGNENLKDINIILPKIINKNDYNFIEMQNEKVLWVNKKDVENIGGKYYVLLDDFINCNKKITEIHDKNENISEKKDLTFSIKILSNKDIFEIENRTGIALEKDSRKARESHIYFFPHIRFKKDVWLVVGLSSDLPISNEGIIEIGAEKRKAYYKEISEFSNLWENINKIKSEFFMSLSNIEGGENVDNYLISTGKIKYLGGWDLKKGFHKPLKGYYPQGSIFSKKISQSFIPVKI